MTDKLLPCPFCGGNDIQIDEMESFWDKNETSWRVLCIDCIAETAGDTKEQAIAAWNRRVDHLPDATKMVSNADRMRGMTDEELANYIFYLGNGSEYCYGHCAYQNNCTTKGLDHDTCIKGVIDWLQQPAKEELT